MNQHVVSATDAIQTVGDARLRNLLRLNAAFCAATATFALVGTDRVARVLGIDAAWVVRAVAVGLLLYALDLLVIAAFQRARLVPWGRAASAADALWVVGTAAIIVTGAVSSSGAVILGLLAIPVGMLALSQWRATVRGVARAADH